MKIAEVGETGFLEVMVKGVNMRSCRVELGGEEEESWYVVAAAARARVVRRRGTVFVDFRGCGGAGAVDALGEALEVENRDRSRMRGGALKLYTTFRL